MLTYLRIKNLALVEEMVFEPGTGYNVITGETGAGKSILMSALALTLGLRAGKGMIRTGADSAVVEALFDISRLNSTTIDNTDGKPLTIPQFLEEKGIEPCEDGLLRLKRSISATGNNRQFVNGTPVSASVLSTIGDALVDIHGPHDHQSLLRPNQQLSLLDAFGKTESEQSFETALSHHEKLMGEYRKLQAELDALSQHNGVIITDADLELLRYQVKEIEDANIVLEQEDAIEARYTRAEHSKEAITLTKEAVNVIEGDDNIPGLSSQLGNLGRCLEAIVELMSGSDEDLKECAHIQREMCESLSRLQGLLDCFLEKVDNDEQAFADLEARIDLLNSLRRKYGKSLADVIKYGKEARKRLELFSNRDAERERLQLEIQKTEKAIKTSAENLHKQRQKIAPILEKTICRHLSDLGFNQSQFSITLSLPTDFPYKETVEYLFSPNPGEPPLPLRSIASTGEIARVMLAIKTALAENDAVPVLVFDEVDANLGGETALAVGRKMRSISAHRQLFCITHLAPVAAAATHHFCVEKWAENKHTLVRLSKLEQKTRIEELARMLGGKTETALHHAENLFKQMQKD